MVTDSQIARDLGITRTKVVSLRHQTAPRVSGRLPLSKQPELIKRVADFIASNGFETLTLGKVRQHLTVTGCRPVPSLSTIQVIIRERLGLTLRRRRTINFRFLSTTLDEKRLWVARMLIALLAKGVLLVCVDESSF